MLYCAQCRIKKDFAGFPKGADICYACRLKNKNQNPPPQNLITPIINLQASIGKKDVTASPDLAILETPSLATSTSTPSLNSKMLDKVTEILDVYERIDKLNLPDSSKNKLLSLIESSFEDSNSCHNIEVENNSNAGQVKQYSRRKAIVQRNGYYTLNQWSEKLGYCPLDNTQKRSLGKVMSSVYFQRYKKEPATSCSVKYYHESEIDLIKQTFETSEDRYGLKKISARER